MLNYFRVKALFLIIVLFLLSSQKLLLAIEESEIPPSVPLGMPSCPWPKDNPYTKKKAELGKLLFFDKRLSSDGTVSCATCHVPGQGYSEDIPIAIGIHGQKGNRNSPTVINTAYQTHCFWDGRASSLEEQVKGPLTNPKEMTSETNAKDAYRECQQCIRKIEGYRLLFKEVFGNDECSVEEISKAIATFERTVISGNSPFDQYMSGNKAAMSKEQIAGLHVFKKVGCANCHGGPNFTDGRFLNIGVGMDSPNPDLGRYEITKNDSEKGAFKIPTLRDVSQTAPYMHDGSQKTLEDVVEYYDRGGTPNRYLSPLLKPLHLTSEEKKALVSFLHALDGEGWQIAPPTQFP
jgi:cytochrome c peroxidase